MPQMASGGIVAFAGDDESLVKDPLALTELFKQRVPDRMPDRPPLTAEEVRAALAAQDSGSGGMAQRLASGVYETAAAIPRKIVEAEDAAIAAVKGLPSALAKRPSQVGGMNVRYATEPAAKKAAATSAAAPPPAPAAPGKKEKVTLDASSEVSSRRPGLAGAAAAFKLPTFNTQEQSVTDIGKELEPFMAQRRKENAELLKPEQTAVDALLKSIEDRKKGDVREQLLGISAAFLSSKSPSFANAAGEALNRYSVTTKEQKAENARAVKEATAAQIALGRSRIALDKGDEATAAKYKEIAAGRADRAMGHQLSGLGLVIQKQQADNQAAHYAAMGDDARSRLKLVQDAASDDKEAGKQFAKAFSDVESGLKNDATYLTATPEMKRHMLNLEVYNRIATNPFLAKYAAGIGASAAPTGKVLSLMGDEEENG